MRTGVATIGLALLLAGSETPAGPAVRDGDIVFQTSRSSQGAAIQKATHSPYSHMGLVLHRKGRPFVLEAIGPARPFVGKPYDLVFAWSDDRIYCSELVWKIYDRALGIRIGELHPLRGLDLSDPIVRAKMRERYGDRLPLDEPVISPAAMFGANTLETVPIP